MKEERQILSEITILINKIETEYPELYRFLDENLITIPSSEHPDLNKKTLEGYLEDLKNLLKHHMQPIRSKRHERFKKNNMDSSKPYSSIFHIPFLVSI